MELIIDTAGTVSAIYDESLDLSALGRVSITRASHVEPDDQGHWLVDLRPSGGPALGPFVCRSAALAAEHAWLGANWLNRPR